MSLRSNLLSGHHRLETILAHARSPLLLLIRLYWGWQFAENGWGKLQHISKIVDYFGTLHVPLPSLMAPAIATLELLGGILLMVGLLTRLTAFLLVCDMIVAFVLGDQEALATVFSSDPSKFLAADPFSFLFASLVLMAFGAGLFALDHYVFHPRGAAAA